MTYKDYKWEVIASDYNSPFLRNYHASTSAFFMWPKLLGVSRPLVGIVSEKNQIKYLSDVSTLEKAHNELKEKILKDYHYVEFLIDKTHKLGEEMNKWTEENIFNVDLTSLNGNELINLLKKFIEFQNKEYVYGIAISILDFGEFSFVEDNLKKFLKEKLNKEEYQEAFQAFTEPIHNSFAQDQEENILRLMEEFYNEKWINDIKNKSLGEIKELNPKFYKKLQEHTKKHCWIYYVYSGPAYTEEDFLAFIKEYSKDSINPTEKLKEIKEKKEKIEKLKKQYLEKLKPDDFNLFILNLAGKIIWGKPRRKDYQSKSYYHIEKLMKEIAKRLYISLNQARSTPIEMLEQGLKGKNIDLKLINEINKFHMCLANGDGTVSVLIGHEAREFYEKEVKKDEEEDLSNISEIKGDTACHGNASGIVKIVNQSPDIAKMKDGNILVSTATTPSIVLAMKKAAAIVTDEGGLTSHAAIVSRELNKPCVIGTKIATKVLKDGDLVEVDADKGIVKILKRA